MAVGESSRLLSFFFAEAPDRVKEIYDLVLPHYAHLHADRLTAAEAAETE